MGIMLIRNSPLSDNQIEWNEIKSKPFGNSPNLANIGDKGISILDNDTYGNTAIQFNRGKSGYSQAGAMYIDWAWQDDTDFDVRLLMNDNYFYLYLAGDQRLAIINLPTSSDGLATNCLWRDSNGYLRIV